MSTETVIVCSNVSVEFTYSNLDYSTLKELVFQRLKGKRQVTKLVALEGVNLEIQRGESVAFIGHNGSGKSTLLKVLAGIIVPKKGSKVVTRGRVAPMIELGTGFDGELSGLENIYLSCAIMGLTKSEIASKISGIISFSELQDFIHMPVKNYSSGMQARLGFACTTAVDPDILLVDEVLAVGDSNFAKKCLERVQALREGGTTIVLVSHDPHIIRSFCDKGYVFDSGILRFAGEVSEALRCHESIMDDRRLRALSTVEREEVERKRKLQADQMLRAEGRATPIPEVTPNLVLLQFDQPVEEIELASPFKLRFDLVIRNSEYFEGNVSLGIALYNEQGVRITGINTIDKALKFSKGDFSAHKRASASFSFDGGIPFLMAGTYKVILGIHDSDLTRTICYRDFGAVTFTNSLHLMNADKDILSVHTYLNDIRVSHVDG